jgi:hypothetical protein
MSSDNTILVLSFNHITQKISIARNRKPGSAYGLRLLMGDNKIGHLFLTKSPVILCVLKFMNIILKPPETLNLSDIETRHVGFYV